MNFKTAPRPPVISRSLTKATVRITGFHLGVRLGFEVNHAR